MSDAPVYHTKSDNIKSEIFRFVSVRPPGRKKTTETLVITYDETRFLEVQKRLFPSLCALKGADYEELSKRLNTIMQAHSSSPNFIPSAANLDSRFPGFSAFYDWTTGVKTENVYTVTAKLESYTGKTVADIVNDRNSHSLLWDNYFYFVIEGTNGAMIQALTEFLRVYAIAQELQKPDRESINSMERASIVLPGCILAILAPVMPAGGTAARVEKRTEAAQVSDEQLAGEVRQLQAAKEEIERKLTEQQVSESLKTAEENAVRDSAALDKEFWAGLSKTTLSAVKNSGIDVAQVTAPGAIARLQNEITARYETAFSRASAGTQYVLLGSHLAKVPQNLPGNDPLKSQQRLTAEEAANLIYNDWWQSQDKAQLLDIQIGDFKRVEQEIKCYVPGEVAHIENILAGEKKTYETRRLTRTEETTTIETETTEETERDTQSNDRFEMERETENVISTDTTITAGIDVSANYGVVKLNASAGFSTNISTENATRQATEYAKSVTDRARNKLVKRIKELRTTTIIREFEDKNFHGIDNEKGSENVVGVYRWVDKIYKASLVNYGRRMMIKFNLVEPSAYYKFSQYSDPFAQVVVPKSPDEIAQGGSLAQLVSFKSINENNYALWAKEYDASVNIPPAAVAHVGKAIAEKLVATDFDNRPSIDLGIKMDDSLVIPAGYEVETIYARAHMNAIYGEGAQASILVGKVQFWYDNNTYHDNSQLKIASTPGTPGWALEYGTGESGVSIPISIHGKNTHSFACNIVIKCRRTIKAYENWQKETYEAIMSAYETKRAEAEYAKSQLAAKAGIQIKGRNPLVNKELVQTELKKGCIEAVRVYTHQWLQHYLKDLDNGVRETNAPGSAFHGEPYLQNPLRQAVHGKYISFMEECFEWDQMTFKFHPYFWGRHEKWTELINQTDNDPLFEKFLSSGSSTVVVPVRPGYEKLFAFYMRTGQLWLGEDIPLAAGLDEFIDAELGDIDPLAEPVVEACWNMKIPTNVVILQQQDGGLAETGLPCFQLKCTCEPENCGCDETCE
jgi:hypothetical protein